MVNQTKNGQRTEDIFNKHIHTHGDTHTHTFYSDLEPITEYLNSKNNEKRKVSFSFYKKEIFEINLSYKQTQHYSGENNKERRKLTRKITTTKS